MIGNHSKTLSFLALFIFLFSLSLQAEDKSSVWTSIGPDGGRFSHLVFSPSALNTVYAISDGTILKSNDSGESWNIISDLNNFELFSIHSQIPNTLFSASGSCINKSIDSGLTWQVISSELCDYFDLQWIFGQEMLEYTFFTLNDPLTQSQRLLIKSTDKSRYEIAESRDGGEHWNISDKIINIPLSPYFPLPPYPDDGITRQNFSIQGSDPEDTTILYAHLLSYVGRSNILDLYKSMDAGLSWVDISPLDSILSNFSNGIVFNSVDSHKLYISASSGWLISHNKGDNWKALEFPVKSGDTFYLADLFVDSIDANTLYATLKNEPTIIAKSIDSGDNWRIIGISPYTVNPRSSFSLRRTLLSINPKDNQQLLMGFNSGIIASQNGGQDWKRVHTGIRHIGGKLTVAQSDNHIMFLGGGIQEIVIKPVMQENTGT